MSPLNFFLAAAACWTGGACIVVQYTALRLRLRAAHLSTPAPAGVAWPPLVCACPHAGSDGVDGFVADGCTPLRYPGEVQYFFLASEDDVSAQERAVSHAAALAARGQHATATITQSFGQNPKVAQLAQLPVEAQKAGYVLCIDSDVAWSSVRADALVARLAACPQLAVVWQPTAPREDVSTWGDSIGAAILAAGPHAMPLLAALDASSPVGKVMAYAPQALAQAGGWAPAAEVLGEDVDVGQRLRAQGYGTDALSGAPARTLRQGEAASAVLYRFVRWLSVVRAQRPGLLPLYPLYMAHLPLLLALWAGVAAGGAKAVWVACGMGVGVASRLYLAWLARRSCQHVGHKRRLLSDSLLGDTVLLGVFGYTLLQRKVGWSGKTRDG